VETLPAEVSSTSAAPPAESNTSASSTATTTVRRSLMEALRFGSKAASVANDSNKDIELRQVLIELHKSGQFKTPRNLEDTLYLEIAPKNKGKYRAAMRLVAKSWTSEQQAKLRTKLGEIELMDVSVEVEQQCLKTMAELEGRDGIGRTKPKLTGLGKRFLDWENKHSPPPFLDRIYKTACAVAHVLSPRKQPVKE
jgi:hypothetical protein